MLKILLISMSVLAAPQVFAGTIYGWNISCTGAGDGMTVQISQSDDDARIKVIGAKGGKPILNELGTVSTYNSRAKILVFDDQAKVKLVVRRRTGSAATGVGTLTMNKTSYNRLLCSVGIIEKEPVGVVCPIPQCAAPPRGCAYDQNPELDENGCAKGCGKLIPTDASSHCPY